MLSKQAWRLHHDSEIMLARVFLDADIFRTVSFFPAMIGSLLPYAWRNILFGESYCKKG